MDVVEKQATKIFFCTHQNPEFTEKPNFPQIQRHVHSQTQLRSTCLGQKPWISIGVCLQVRLPFRSIDLVKQISVPKQVSIIQITESLSRTKGRGRRKLPQFFFCLIAWADHFFSFSWTEIYIMRSSVSQTVRLLKICSNMFPVALACRRQTLGLLWLHYHMI